MSAVGNYEVVSQTSTGTTVMTAPPGKKILSGGYNVGSVSNAVIFSSYPSPDGTQWTFNTGSFNPTYTSYIVCAEMGC